MKKVIKKKACIMILEFCIIFWIVLNNELHLKKGIVIINAHIIYMYIFIINTYININNSLLSVYIRVVSFLCQLLLKSYLT